MNQPQPYSLVKTLNLESLLRHIQAFPPQLYPSRLMRLADPRVCLKAMLWDFWQTQWQTSPEPLRLNKWLADYGQVAEQTSGLILACWTLTHPALKQHLTRAHFTQLCDAELLELLNLIQTTHWITQAHRREEWGRWWCRELGLQIENETPLQSERRWQRLSSLKRSQLFQELRQQRRRQFAIQRAQARQQSDLD